MTRSRSILAAVLILAATAAALLAMGRPAICTCGTIALWEPDAAGPRTSQMLSDWYSASHLVHGFLFYGMLSLVARHSPAKPTVERRFVVAVLIESAWEIAENTPMIINRYRDATAALGYTGDAVLNSMSDLTMMAIGFALARRLPVWASAALVLVLELLPLLVIRDNLTLNVWMLLAPNDAIRSWQSGT